MQKNKTVDVIIPVHYPDEKFQKILDRLSKQTYPVNQIIIINTDIEGYPEDKIRRPDNMKLFHINNREFDHAITRDQGARESDADLMLFMTQDAVPADRHLIEELVNAFEDPKVAVAYGRQIPDKNAGPIERFTRNYNYPAESCVKTMADIDKLGIKAFFCSDSCAMYRKKIFTELGGFVPQAIFNEDMIFASFAVKAGYSVYYQAKARVIHSHNYSAAMQFRRNFDNGVSHFDCSYAFDGIRPVGEGINLVKKTFFYLCSHGEFLQTFRLFYISAAKALGFYMGKHYYRLPDSIVRKLSLNKNYWDREDNQ